MKKRIGKVALMSILLMTGAVATLTSCGDTNEVAGEITLRLRDENNTSVAVGDTLRVGVSTKNDGGKGYTSTSSDPSIATVEKDTITGVKVGSCTITFALVNDPSVKKDLTIQVTEGASSNISVSIVGDTTSAIIGGTSLKFTANVEGAGTANVLYKWEALNKKANLTGASKQQVTVAASKSGAERLQCTVTVGALEASAVIDLDFSADYSSYTKISTKDEFMALYNGGGDLRNNYYLSSDIDLGGEKLDGKAKQVSLSGIFDGRGHKLTNFEVVSADYDAAALHRNSGLFASVSSSGIITDVHFSGMIDDEGAGWGTGLIVNELSGTVENCVIETKHNYNNAKNADNNGWFPFNGSICGILKEGAVVRDCVVNVTTDLTGEDAGAAGVNMAIAAYPAGGHESDGSNNAFTPSDQSFIADNIYTNQPKAATLGSAWEWGNSIENDETVYSNINFGSASKATYKLSEAYWNLSDGQMPTLKAFND